MDYEKFVTAISLMETCIAASAPIVTDRGSTIENAECHRAWDAIYEHIFATFQDPVSTAKEDELIIECRDRLKAEGIDAENEVQLCCELLKMGNNNDEFINRIKAIPPLFAEVVFPVALARYMLRYVGLSIMPARLATFNEFHRRYGYMILAPYYK